MRIYIAVNAKSNRTSQGFFPKLKDRIEAIGFKKKGWWCSTARWLRPYSQFSPLKRLFLNIILNLDRAPILHSSVVKVMIEFVSPPLFTSAQNNWQTKVAHLGRSVLNILKRCIWASQETILNVFGELILKHRFYHLETVDMQATKPHLRPTGLESLERGPNNLCFDSLPKLF